MVDPGTSGSHDGSGDLMGHGGSGVLREKWREAPSMKVLGELQLPRGGTLEASESRWRSGQL